MAARADVVLQLGVLFPEEQFSGEICCVCKDPIYGKGYRLTIHVKNVLEDLPSFRDTKYILCQSCREGLI